MNAKTASQVMLLLSLLSAPLFAASTKTLFAKVSAEEELETRVLEAEVFHCHDGDTCRLMAAGGIWLNVRLAGVDAPEVGNRRKKEAQEYGGEARDFLNTKVKATRKWFVHQVDLDPYNRPVVFLFSEDPNTGKTATGIDLKRSINYQLVMDGYAEVYRGPTKRFDKNSLFAAEEEAKKAKRGIWGLSSYVSPAQFRKKK